VQAAASSSSASTCASAASGPPSSSATSRPHAAGSPRVDAEASDGSEDSKSNAADGA
jgi:hypothetical protein